MSNQPTAIPSNTGIDYERFLDCVHCGLCTSACPTYLETGNENDSPRGRIYLMRAVQDGRIELSDKVSRHLDLCLDCRSCETACPSGVEYGRLIEPFRVEMAQKQDPAKSKTPGWFQKWILHGMFPYPERMKWALWPMRVLQATGLDRVVDALALAKLAPGPLRRMHRLLPKLRSRGAELPGFLPAKGEKRATVALFTGCVADVMFHHVNVATAKVLQANGCDVHIPRSQSCCGAIHYHSGADQPALELAKGNAKAFDIDDLDAVIVNVAGCGSMLKDYGHLEEEVALRNGQSHSESNESSSPVQQLASKIKDVSEFLAELGPIAPSKTIEQTVTYHDACHLCHAQQIRTQPRQLLGMIPGLKLETLAESEICCGAAGSYNLTEPEMASRLGNRKVDNIEATNAKMVVTGNAGCALQIQAVLKERGHDMSVVHPIELLAESYGL